MNYRDNINKIAVIGGDMRMLYCAENLHELGFETALCGFDKAEKSSKKCTRCDEFCDSIRKADVVILPLSVSSDDKTVFAPFSKMPIDIDAVFSCVEEKAVVLGGNISEGIKQKAQTYGIKLHDYFEMEELKIANAYLTAESALAIALSEQKNTIHESPVLVMGYGRIGKALCHLLKSMGANVYASARKNSDFAWIRAFGYSPVKTNLVSDVLSSCKLVFNTIPESVLTWEKLCMLDKDCLVIDLASKPGGVDFEAARVCGIKVIWALGLPGKMKEVSAGKVISDTIVNILEDEVKDI